MSTHGAQPTDKCSTPASNEVCWDVSVDGLKVPGVIVWAQSWHRARELATIRIRQIGIILSPTQIVPRQHCG